MIIRIRDKIKIRILRRTSRKINVYVYNLVFDAGSKISVAAGQVYLRDILQRSHHLC
jgi:hypothetical protein